MKFFEMKIMQVLIYGYIYDNGMYEVNMWHFDADDYRFRDGKASNVKSAWRVIYANARAMNKEDENIFYGEDEDEYSAFDFEDEEF